MKPSIFAKIKLGDIVQLSGNENVASIWANVFFVNIRRLPADGGGIMKRFRPISKSPTGNKQYLMRTQLRDFFLRNGKKIT